MGKVRKQIFFSGTVQGVGFRYRALYLADAYDLTGWVKNLYDGRVQMQVQGDEHAIYAFLNALGEQRFIYIEDLEIHSLPVDKGEQRFRVR